MKLLKCVLLGLSVLFAANASAGWHTAKISTIHTYLNGGVAVFLNVAHECGSTRVGLDSSTPGFQRVFSALLAYEAQGKNVKFAIQSCSGTVAIADRVVSVN